MTYRGKSDSQLDAEATVRRTDTPVGELIEDHRALYRADLYLSQVNVDFGESPPERSSRKSKPKTNGHPATWTGRPFNPAFESFIDWDRRRQAAGVRPSHPGPLFPWSQAFYAQWAECRRSHPEHHDRPEWRGSLCYQLVSWTVRHERSLTDACLILGVTVPRAGRTLRNALLWIEGYIDRQRARDEQRQLDANRPAYKVYEPPAPSEERHDQPGIHRETCPKCIKKRGEAA